MARFIATLVDKTLISPSVVRLVFERDDGPLEFVPGQWVNVFSSVGAVEEKRSYSIASAPNGSGRFELWVTRVSGGTMSAFLHALAVGAKVEMLGPMGLFTRAATDPSPAVFVGTGTGVAPLRSMIEAAHGGPRFLLAGFRHEADILFKGAFDELSRRDPTFQWEVTLSQPSAGWLGLSGYVQSHLERVMSACPNAQLYICGLDRMVKEVRAAAKALGLPRGQIHYEKYD